MKPRVLDYLIRLPNGKVVPLSPEEMDALNGKRQHTVRRRKCVFLPGVKQDRTKNEKAFFEFVTRTVEGVTLVSYYPVKCNEVLHQEGK